ncbi:MAG: choice-of-anchor D domain-containing protein, partial [Candidatus Krumholzibacteriota bacterium]
WCNENDSFQLDGADWLFKDGSSGNIFGVAHDANARSVAMGENLAGVWYANEQLNANAVIWMMEGGHLPAVDPTEGVLAPGGIQTVDVTFEAGEICGGTFLANLVVGSNDPLAPEILVPADMHVTGEPAIVVSDTLVAFGPVFLGDTVADTVIISNLGCDVLTVRPFMAIRIQDAGFDIDTTHFDLQVGESRGLEVTYSPTAVGPAVGEFTLASNDPDQPAVIVSLSGEGLLPPVVGVDPASLAANLLPDEIEIQQLTITNTGASDLVWDISRVRRDSTAAVMQAAAAAVVEGISPSSSLDEDGLMTPCLSVDDKSLLESRLLDYRMTASSLQGENVLPLVGVGGYHSSDLMFVLLSNPELTGMFTFDLVDYANDDLAALDGLAISERDGDISNNGMLALRDFYDSRRGIMIGMDDWDAIWSEPVRVTLEPVFGIDIPIDSNFCANPGLNTLHPINEGIPSFIVADPWCNDNDAFQMTTAEWLFKETSLNNIFGAANDGLARTVVMGESLARVWPINEQLNVNALLWIMEGSGLPGVDPAAGTVAPGGTQIVDVIFDATGLTSGEFLSNLIVSSNDPVTPEVVVPADMTVASAPMTVIVSVTAGAASDMDNTLGIAEDATDGFDGQHDLPEPPHAPADYIAGYFHHPEWGSPLGDRFMTDIRAPYNPALEMKSWPFVVETDVSDIVTMVFTPSFPDTSGWDLWLRDDATGAMKNLYPTLTHTFTPGAGPHPFTIFVGKIMPPLYPTERQIAAGWSMLGAPLVPPAGSGTWGDVLLDDAPGATFMFDYQGASGYGDVVGTDPVVQGQGLWLASTDNFSWTMEGDPDDGTIDVPAMIGWNLIGYPLWIAGGLGGVSVEHAGQQYLWSDAVAAGLVSPFVYDYDGVADTYIPVTALEPWHGYWMAAHVAGVTIQFNYRSMLAAPVAVTSEPADDTSRLPLLVQKAPAGKGDKALDPGWQLNVNLAQGMGEVVIGRTVGATAGFDAAFDLPAPPPSPSSTAKTTLDIRHPEWNLACGAVFYSDLVPLDSEPREWNLTVTAPEPGTVTLNWDPAGLPADVDLQVYLPHENRVVVYSVRDETGLQVDVGAEPLQVQFRTPNGISGVADQLAGLRLRNAPNPFNPLTVFQFNLPHAGKAEIRIYDVRGAVVRRVSGGMMAAGPTKLQWAGRDGRGREVASGIYFYRLYLDGKQEGSTLKMTLLK